MEGELLRKLPQPRVIIAQALACPVIAAQRVTPGLARDEFAECVCPQAGGKTGTCFPPISKAAFQPDLATEAQKPTASWQFSGFHTSIFESLGNE